MAEKMTLIEIDNVTKTFELPHEKQQSLKSLIVHPTRMFKNNHTTQVALKDISLSIKEGEFVGIVGKNGSGKSTLLKLLAGIYVPTKGSVRVAGRLMPFIELGVGFNPELTGKENIYLSGALLGFSEKEMRDRYASIVEFAELENFMDQKLKNYSSGMQVRLAFSIATQSETDIFLIDEVLAVGDTAFQRKCFDYFKKLKREKKTVILVTHDMDAVRQYCDRAILIEKGLIKADSSPREVANLYDLSNQRSLESSKGKVDDTIQRWGNKKLTITKASIDKPTYLVKDRTIKVDVKIKAKSDVEDVAFGLTVSDSTGKIITGINNSIAGKKTIDLQKGKTIQIDVLIPNIFSDGRYYIDLGVNESKNVADKWPSALEFQVSKNLSSGFTVTPEIELNFN